MWLVLLLAMHRRPVPLGVGSRPRGRSRRGGPRTYRRKRRGPNIRGRKWCGRSGRISTGCGSTRFGRAATKQPAKWDGEILVPFPIESALSGVKKTGRARSAAVVSALHSMSSRRPSERVLLHFGAVDWRCTVWVNDKQVGQHSGGYDPFTFDITDALRDERQRFGHCRLGSDRHGHAAARQAGAEAARDFLHGGDRHLANGVARAGAEAVHIESLKIVPDVDRKVVIVDDKSTADRRLAVVRVAILDRRSDSRSQSERESAADRDHADSEGQAVVARAIRICMT